MGTDYDSNARDIVIDEFAESGVSSIRVSRIQTRVNGRVFHVSWGMEPSGSGLVVERFADSTFFIWRKRFSEDDDLLNEHYRPLEEILHPDRDNSYYYTTYDRPADGDGGVYHALFPRLFVPEDVAVGRGTRLVNVKQCGSMRFAFTWLFSSELQLSIRITQVADRVFRRMRVSRSLTSSPDGNSEFAELTEERARPSRRDMWRIFLNLLKSQ